MIFFANNDKVKINTYSIYIKILLMEKIRFFLTALTVLVTTVVASAQSGVVKGVVKDSGTGEAIPFAALRVKGTMSGTSTDADGAYSINVADKASAVLVFSSINYKVKEVAVAGKSVIDVMLEVDATALEDVVVVAYGTQRKEAVTGSVSSLKSSSIADAPVTSVDKMLSGKLAGVTISATSGQPGALSQIRIRGTGSINASNAPLWVVDGIPILSGNIATMTNQSSLLANLNPNDIESITVLKDAAASAAYGSRAANGVILVTTKSGKEGQTRFSASAKTGINWLQSDTGFRMMNARELLTFQRDAVFNAGMDPDDPTGTYYRPLSLLNGPLYNVVNEFTKLGRLQEYEITATGGNTKSKYYSSFSYHNNEGVFHGIKYERLQGMLNASYKLLDNLETGVRMNISYTDQTDVPMQKLYGANPLWSAMNLLPWYEIKTDGQWIANKGLNSGDHPRATAIYDDRWEHIFKLNGTFNLKWTPIKNLDIETKESVEAIFQNSRNYFSPLAHANVYANQLETVDRQIYQMTTSNTVSYSNILGGYHSFRILAGQEAMRYKSISLDAYSPEVDKNIPYHNTADQSKTQIENDLLNETMLSFLSIADYSYDNKYFAQATLRTDGSSLFGEDNKWGLFWSLSGSWNMAKEKWFKAVKPVALLKIRLSYGVNGNNGIDAYKAYGLYKAVIYNGLTGYQPSQLSNKQLSWEKNKTLNLGIDFGLFENRLSGSVDIYNRLTEDLLLDKQVPQTTGFSTIFDNVGSMVNKGVEFQLSGDIIRTKDMLLTLGANVAFNRTTILDLGGDEYIGTWRRHVKGKSMYTYYLYDYYGVNPSNGEALWVTEDGSLTNQQAKARRYYAGSPEPKAVGGFNIDFQWKGLSLGAAFEFKSGNKVLLLNEHKYLENDGSDLSMNQMFSAYNYWREPGDTGVNPKPVAGTASNSNEFLSDRWLEDGSFLRIKDVTLAYSLPKKWVEKIYMKGVRLYVSGLNLYCFNDVNFWDPEQGVTGVTGGQYPITKSIVGGIEITF